jgi:hypothetical protein
MDSGLNRNAGFFIKNFYQVAWRPRASERELMIASVISTLVMGALVIGAGVWFASLNDMPIFKLMVNFGAWVALPISIPLVLGIFVKRAPQWAGWTTVLVGLAASFVTNRFLDAQWAASLVGHTLNRREADDWAQLAGILMNLVVGSGWFLLTAMLARTRSPAEIERVDRFFTEMHTPVDFAAEEGAGSDNLQAKVMGMLCLIYGGFITLLALIPNPLIGRLAFVFCGGVMFGVGALLKRASKTKAKESPAQKPTAAVPASA